MIGLLVCLSSFVAPPSAVVMRQQLARAAAPSMGLIPERGAANNPRRNGASSTSSVLYKGPFVKAGSSDSGAPAPKPAPKKVVKKPVAKKVVKKVAPKKV